LNERIEGRLAAIGYIAVVACALAAWHAKVTGTLGIADILACAALPALGMALGGVLAAFAPLPSSAKDSLSFRFVLGFLAFDALLLAVTLVSPLGMRVDAALAAAAVLAAAGLARGRVRRLRCPHAGTDLAALAICALGATLWCRDALTPIVVDGASAVFRVWIDSFVHARIMSAIAQAASLATFSDIRMSATPVYLYHYASYVAPAAFAAWTGTPAFDVYASLFLPFGVMLTGIAAYAMVRSWWGPYPALAAAVAVVLLPDAYQQGFGNRYLSYHFMQQVNLGGLYGVSCAAMAWLFVIAGCCSRSLGAVAIGIAISGLTLFFKAHVFIANALLVLLYPCLFFAGSRAPARAAAAAGAIGIFALGTGLADHIDRAPTIRFDGSGAPAYVARVAWNYDPGRFAGWLDVVARGEHLRGATLYAVGLPMLLVSTFGLWLIAALAAGFSLRRRVPGALLAFPALVIVNYLAMAFGLALDEKGIGSPDELLNRPLVWAYFALAAWTGGAVWYRLYGEGAPGTTAQRAVAALVLAAAFAFPWIHGANLETNPRWEGYESYASASKAPACLVTAARFLRDSSTPGDLVQVSDNDPRFLVAGLAERAAYVTVAENRPPAGMAERLRELAAWRSMKRVEDIDAFAAQRGIGWYLLLPSTAIAWPPQALGAPRFECGGYRVYRLPL
jgi:hypothetical protein